jgi:hypothetical protein
LLPVHAHGPFPLDSTAASTRSTIHTAGEDDDWVLLDHTHTVNRRNDAPSESFSSSHSKSDAGPPYLDDDDESRESDSDYNGGDNDKSESESD